MARHTVISKVLEPNELEMAAEPLPRLAEKYDNSKSGIDVPKEKATAETAASEILKA